MGAYYQRCGLCAAEFRADESQKAAYDAARDPAERQRLLGVINAYWALKFHMEAAHPEAMFECPRQGEGMSYSGKPEAFWEGDGTCSYCGSLSPVRFFECVEAGGQVTPTDKSYKAYVEAPVAHPDELYVCGASNGECPGEGWVPSSDVDDETLRRSNWSRHGHTWLLLKPRGPTRTAKFYFQHFDDAERGRFCELVNKGRMKMAYPGHFYVTPYFARRIAG